MAEDFTLDDFRRQLGQIPKMEMRELVGHMPDPSEEDLVSAFNRLHQMNAAMTAEERQVLNRLPRMTAAMTGEERLMVQSIWQSVQIRQMIDAMTDEERSNPDLIDSSQRTRIATNSGMDPQEVEKFLAQFHHVRAVVREVAGWSLWQRLKMGFRGLRDLGTFKALNGMLIVILVVAFVFILVAKLGWVW